VLVRVVSVAIFAVLLKQMFHLFFCPCRFAIGIPSSHGTIVVLDFLGGACYVLPDPFVASVAYLRVLVIEHLVSSPDWYRYGHGG
jgi:hypothetical protein